MVNVSSTLKNRLFFTMRSFLTMLHRPPVGLRGVLCINKNDIRRSRNLKKCEKFKILLESCQVTSKLSADSFMGRWDRMVPQKMDFKKKIFEKVLNSCNPPPGYRTAWYTEIPQYLPTYRRYFGKYREYRRYLPNRNIPVFRGIYRSVNTAEYRYISIR